MNLTVACLVLACVIHDTTEAQRLMDNFYELQMQHIQHRDRIRKELQK